MVAMDPSGMALYARDETVARAYLGWLKGEKAGPERDDDADAILNKTAWSPKLKSVTITRALESPPVGKPPVTKWIFHVTDRSEVEKAIKVCPYIADKPRLKALISQDALDLDLFWSDKGEGPYTVKGIKKLLQSEELETPGIAYKTVVSINSVNAVRTGNMCKTTVKGKIAVGKYDAVESHEFFHAYSQSSDEKGKGFSLTFKERASVKVTQSPTLKPGTVSDFAYYWEGEVENAVFITAHWGKVGADVTYKNKSGAIETEKGEITYKIPRR